MTGATSYVIRRSLSDMELSNLGLNLNQGTTYWLEYRPTGSNTYFTIPNLIFGSLYEVNVKATNSGNNKWSSSIFTYPTSDPPPKLLDIEGLAISGYRIHGTTIGYYPYVLCSNVIQDDPKTSKVEAPRVITVTEEIQIKSAAQTWVDATGLVSFDQETRVCQGSELKKDILQRRTINIVRLLGEKAILGFCASTAGCLDHIIPLGRVLDDPERPNEDAMRVSHFFVNGDYDSIEPATQPFDSDGCSSMFQVAMHEFGHVFGLRDSAVKTVTNTIMSASGIYIHCEPTEKDIAVVKAIYQSRPRSSSD